MAQDHNDIYSIVERLAVLEGRITPANVKHGLNTQQKSVPQMPALFKPKTQKILGGNPNAKNPMSGYAVGGCEEEVESDKEMAEDASMTWDGVSPDTKEFTSEDVLEKVKKSFTDFVKEIEKIQDSDLKDKKNDDNDLRAKDKTDRDLRPKQVTAEGLEQQYLWHGSRQKIPMLEPRQSVDTGGAAGSNQNAIYATSDPKVAIAMGLTTPGSDTGMFPNDPQMVLFSGKIRKGENVYLHKLPFYGPNGKPQFVQGGNDREFHSIPGVKAIKPVEIKAVPVDRYLNLVRQATPQDLELRKELTKEGVAEDSGAWPFQEINELSNDKLAQYKSAAGRAATAADRAGNYELGNKRFRGITQATKKQFANDVKKHKPQ